MLPTVCFRNYSARQMPESILSMSVLILLHSRSYRCDFHIVEQSFAMPKKMYQNHPGMNRAWQKNSVMFSHPSSEGHMDAHCARLQTLFALLPEANPKIREKFRLTVCRTETEGIFLQVLTSAFPRVSAGITINAYSTSSVTGKCEAWCILLLLYTRINFSCRRW